MMAFFLFEANENELEFFLFFFPKIKLFPTFECIYIKSKCN